MSVPYLCIGTFFFLLIQARKPKEATSTNTSWHIDPMSDACFMNGLVGAFTGKRHEINRDSFDLIKRHTSPLRECKEDGSKKWTPFNQQPAISNYRQIVQNNYSDAVERMSEFVDEYLDEDKYDWLVDALIGTIEHDSGIPEGTLFYIMPHGETKTKAQMRDITVFELQPLLVGVLYYIVDKRSKSNSDGKDTLNTWGNKPNTNKERELKSDVVLGVNRRIKAHYYIAGEDDVAIEPETEEVEPVVEAEICEDKKNSSDRQEHEEHEQEPLRGQMPFGTYIQNQYNAPVIMTGDHAKNYTVNGNVTINHWEDDSDD